MSLPKFNAEAALGKPSRTYHGQYRYSAFGEGQTGTAASVLPNQLFGEEATGVGEDVAGLDDGTTIDLTDEAPGDEFGGADAESLAGLDDSAAVAGVDVVGLDDSPTIDLTDDASLVEDDSAGLDDGLPG